ncbi:MAG: hypothetical protein ACLU4J_13640 [Butyricimonas paravirosa]
MPEKLQYEAAGLYENTNANQTQRWICIINVRWMPSGVNTYWLKYP